MSKTLTANLKANSSYNVTVKSKGYVANTFTQTTGYEDIAKSVSLTLKKIKFTPTVTIHATGVTFKSWEWKLGTDTNKVTDHIQDSTVGTAVSGTGQGTIEPTKAQWNQSTLVVWVRPTLQDASGTTFKGSWKAFVVDTSTYADVVMTGSMDYYASYVKLTVTVTNSDITSDDTVSLEPVEN